MNSRTGGFAGLVSMAVMTVAVMITPAWPPAPSSGSEIGTWFSQHRSGFIGQVLLLSLGGILLLPWADAWRARSSRRRGNYILVGAAVFAAELSLFFVPWLAIVMEPALGDDSRRVLYEIGLYGQFPLVGPPLALLFGALTTAPGRSRAGAATSCVACAVNLLLVGCVAQHGFFAAGGPIGAVSTLASGAAIAWSSVELLLPTRSSAE